MPTGVYERKPRTTKAKDAQTTTTTKTTKSTQATPKAKRTRTTKYVGTNTTVAPLPVDPNQTSTEWQELRYNEVLEHPTWMKSTEHLARKNLALAKAKKIRRRVITRSQWEVIE